MSFISYAQNREDVLLWRALGHVKNGFYIDVGANDPLHDSVTNAFYQRGWWGINIEPVPSLHRLLCEQRPRDVNLGVAAGAAAAEITLFDLPEVNGWATANPDVAARHRADGHHVVEARVPVRTLNDICTEHARGDIHFLKIDVEGFEEEVLRGIDFGRWRPWIVVVEATMPNSRETNHGQWERLVSAHNYQYACFDGLNRYYVAGEHAELVAVLGTPPNVFDDFIPAQLDQAWRQLTELGALQEQSGLEAHALRTRAAERERELAAQLQAREEYARAQMEAAQAAQAAAQQAIALSTSLVDASAALEARARQAEQGVAELQAQQAQLQAELALGHAAHEKTDIWARGLEEALRAMQQSSSWRITAPLRRIGPLAPRALLRRLVMWAMRQPRLRQGALRLMRRYPALAARLRGSVAGIVHPTPRAKVAQYAPPAHLKNVPVSARKVLDDLLEARASHPAGRP